jgi:crotonobetainyl-CoA:carnitine CoA-transferase CaiB-like acyl-CoA transferase
VSTDQTGSSGNQYAHVRATTSTAESSMQPAYLRGMEQLFRHLKVVDLSTVLAGPSVGTFLAEMGAQVVKIENPITGGDVTRQWKLPSENPISTVSAYFAAVNYGKTYRWLDLNQPEHREALHALLSEADVLIHNYKLGDDVRFGLAFAQLHERYPRLVVAHLKGYDSTPGRVAYDVVLQAESGFMYMNGYPDSAPVKMPVALIDVLAAHQLKEGILCALYQRTASQKGCLVACSLEKAALASLVNQSTNFLMANEIPQRIGSLHPNIAPYGETFLTADEKYIVLAVGSDRQFASLCHVLGIDQVLADERFAHNPQRVVHRKALGEALAPVFKQHPAAHWTAALQRANVPAGAVLRMDEVMQSKAAEAMLRHEVIDGIATTRLSSVAFTLSASES